MFYLGSQNGFLFYLGVKCVCKQIEFAENVNSQVPILMQVSCLLVINSKLWCDSNFLLELGNKNPAFQKYVSNC